jgi:serine/threonine protein kinase
MADSNVKELINELQEQNVLPHAGKIIGGSRNQFDKEGRVKQGHLFSIVEKKPIGEGGFSSVYPATLYRRDETGVTKKSNPKKRFVTKEFNLEELKKTFDGVSIENLIEKEFEFCRVAGHLSIKPPVYENNKCYLTMKRMPGKSLDAIFFKLMDGTYYLNENQRIKLSYALLLALKTQVIDKGIIHRDIKPANIHVKIDETMEVNIFDYGLAKKAGEEDGLYPGSPFWVAPELFNELAHDNKADIFSMGRIIAFLCGQSVASYLTGQPFDNSRLAAKNLNLYQSLKWLEPFLKQMLAEMQTDRIDIDSAMKQFKQLVSINAPMLQLPPYEMDNYPKSNNFQFFQNSIENAKSPHQQQLIVQRHIKVDLQVLLEYLPSQYSHYRSNKIFKNIVGPFTKIQKMMNELKGIVKATASEDIPQALNNFINHHQNKLLDASEASIMKEINKFLKNIEPDNLANEGYRL